MITGFLLLVSLLAATQSVQSQQYATTTLTTLVTSNQLSTVTVGTQVVTTTSGQVTPVYAGPVTILGTHGVCGEYFFHGFNATAGEVLTGSVTANTTVNVYVMTPTAFQAWQHQVVAGGTCTPSNPVSSQTGATSYTLNTAIPATGNYELIVHNLSESGITAQITANLTSAAPSLITVVAYSTATQPMVQTLMQTSTQTLQPTASSGPDMTTIGAIIFAIIIIAAAAYIAKTRRNKTPKK